MFDITIREFVDMFTETVRVKVYDLYTETYIFDDYSMLLPDDIANAVFESIDPPQNDGSITINVEADPDYID